MKQRKNTTIPKSIMAILCVVLLLCMTFLGAAFVLCYKSVANVSADETLCKEETFLVDKGVAMPFELYLLDVGQGTSVLINCQGHWMLYDGGDANSSSYLVSFLKQKGIEKLDYIVASHYDADHISGLVGVLHVFSCDTVLTPDYETDTDIYHSFVNMLEENGAHELHPLQGDRFDLGRAQVDVVGPFTYSYTEENDRSICIRVSYGACSFLMCGDAGIQAESDMVSTCGNLQSDLLLVSHHGSAYASGEDFLNKVKPKYALVSCNLGNSYGHPAEETLSRLQNTGCKLYRTDLQKDIVSYSDGMEILFNQEATDNWSSGDILSGNQEDSIRDSSVETGSQPVSEAENVAESGQTEYICNTNTMKFHYPSCKSVKQMKESNKKNTNESRDELISQGYESCGNCHP